MKSKTFSVNRKRFRFMKFFKKEILNIDSVKINHNNYQIIKID